jgi:membrane-bound metal-dependent hydrolase YbcI (DUF457 family)
MFIGHYGVSFAAKRLDKSIPLWVLFVAVQLLDVFWSPFILLGIEKVRIVPGITASNPLDLYYMPYTHSLVAALLWSAGGFILYKLLAKPGSASKAALVVALAVFSHWVLDFVVHRPDLPLYDNTAKVGLGLWNFPILAFALETALLFGGMWLFFGVSQAPRLPMILFGLVMVVIQAYVFFGPPPVSDKAAAATALAAYVVFAAVAARLERARRPSASGAV